MVVRASCGEALGVAHLAGVGVGMWQVGEINDRWSLDHTFEPRMPADLRDELYQGWTDAVASARSFKQS